MSYTKKFLIIATALLLLCAFIYIKSTDTNIEKVTAAPTAPPATQTIEKKQEIPKKVVSKPKTQVIKTANGEVNITLPTVPTPPKVTQVVNASNDRSITFSKRVPPNYIPHRLDVVKKEKVTVDTHTNIGKVNHGRISAHLRGSYVKIEEVKKRLEKAGFTILAVASNDKEKTLTSIVFTNEAILDMANKEDRGFIATLRILIDSQEKAISITNPLYMCKGFLQSDFNEKSANDILQKITDNFPDLKNSKDALKYQLLPNYQFMFGMPHYEDTLEVASGDKLLAQIKDNNKTVFTQTLKNGAVLVGVRLSEEIRTFTKTIGRKNAALLPYMVLIEDGKAKILDPKFYIAYMYPLLSMSEFMKISSIPDEIYQDIQNMFNK